MNSLMTTLQQPLSMAVLAQCLGWGSRPAQRAMKRRSRHISDSRRRAKAATAEAVPEQPADEAAAPGCGWFDSSHELHQGLVVLEHSGAEGLATELPVTVWLQLALDVDVCTAGAGDTGSTYSTGDEAGLSLRA